MNTSKPQRTHLTRLPPELLPCILRHLPTEKDLSNVRSAIETIPTLHRGVSDYQALETARSIRIMLTASSATQQLDPHNERVMNLLMELNPATRIRCIDMLGLMLDPVCATGTILQDVRDMSAPFARAAFVF